MCRPCLFNNVDQVFWTDSSIIFVGYSDFHAASAEIEISRSISRGSKAKNGFIGSIVRNRSEKRIHIMETK